MGQVVSVANSKSNSNSGRDMMRMTERDKPIYIHVAISPIGRSRWYSIEDEGGQVQDDDNDDDGDDPILLLEGKAYSQTTDRFRRLQVPRGLSCNKIWYEDAYRHVVVNDTVYAMGTGEHLAYSLLEKQQQSESSGEVPSIEFPEFSNPESVVKYRSNLLSTEIFKLDASEKKPKLNPRIFSRNVIPTFKASSLEGLKLAPLPTSDEDDGSPGMQYSALASDHGWIYTLGIENWSLDVNSGRRFGLPNPELAPDVMYNPRSFRLLGATRTKLFAYLETVIVGDHPTSILYCLDLETLEKLKLGSAPESEIRRWQWREISKDQWQGIFSPGVVREYANGDSYMFCCGVRIEDGFFGLYVFDINNGVWLPGPVEGDLFIPGSCTDIPFLVDVGHQKMAAVWCCPWFSSWFSSGVYMEIHWCKFTIKQGYHSQASTPTFSTQLVSRGARRISLGSMVDCIPGIPL